MFIFKLFNHYEDLKTAITNLCRAHVESVVQER